jgi:hypothetical protein
MIGEDTYSAVCALQRSVIMIKFAPYSIYQSWILRGDRLFAFHARGEVVRKVVIFLPLFALSEDHGSIQGLSKSRLLHVH